MKTTEQIYSEVSKLVTCHIHKTDNYDVVMIDSDTEGKPIKGMKLQIRHGWRKKNMYDIYDFQRDSLSEADYSSIEKDMHKAGIQEPQNMGVLTAKKLQSWIDYYNDRRVRITAAEAEASRLIAEFKESIKPYKPQYNKDQTRGYIQRSGLEFTFEITPSGYIHQHIKVDADSHNLKTFLKLTNNK
jgi:hypothetical protein